MSVAAVNSLYSRAFKLKSSTGAAVSGEAANFAKALYYFNGTTWVVSSITVTVTEIGSTGFYHADYTPTAAGTYFVSVTHPTYNVAGFDDTLDATTDGNLTLAGIITAIADGFTAHGQTLRKALRILMSNAAGKSSGFASNAPVFRAVDDSKDVITATIDTNGDRTAVTVDAS